MEATARRDVHVVSGHVEVGRFATAELSVTEERGELSSRILVDVDQQR